MYIEIFLSSWSQWCPWTLQGPHTSRQLEIVHIGVRISSRMKRYNPESIASVNNIVDNLSIFLSMNMIDEWLNNLMLFPLYVRL